MVDLMKIEDQFSPPGDWPDLNKLRRTKQPLSVLGRKPVLCLVCSQVCSSPEGGQSTKTPSWRGHQLLPPGTTQVPPRLHLLYWCCRVGEREWELGLEGRELPLGACRAWGSSC